MASSYREFNLVVGNQELLKANYLERFSSTLYSCLENLAASRRVSKRAVSMMSDATMAVLALWLAYSLRYGVAFTDFKNTWYLFVAVAFLIVLVNSGLGVYRWVVRSTNLRLFRQLVKASALVGLSYLILAFLFPPEGVTPRSVFLIFGTLLLLGTLTMRVIWRSLFDSGEQGEPIAIYGAGSSGRQLFDSLAAGSEFRPVLFIDDAVTLQSTTLSGIPVVASSDIAILKLELEALEVGRIVLAMPSLTQEQYSDRLQHIKQLSLPVQTVPSMVEMLTGSGIVDQIRDVSVKDILGRSVVTPDAAAVARSVSGKTVLVTGGGGSIGSELCRQIHLLGAKRLIVLDHSEENLYHITEELHKATAAREITGEVTADFVPALCSVKDERRIRRLIEKYQVNTIYHAAAYKHVPIIESEPQQGVETNVFGTNILLNVAVDAGVENFTLISTDKAVRPTNAMGASKRVAELILQAKAQEEHKTKISMVRFGNVLGSSGSVVPKFKEQIRQGGPITITHPDITRYFMTIPEAAQLVLQASAIAEGGDVFVLDMGKPLKIIDLAKTMVALSGAKLQSETGKSSDIEIVYEGLRPGEKMYEELFITDNSPTSIPKVFTASENWLRSDRLNKQLAQLEEYVVNDDDKNIKKLLLSLAFTGAESTTDLKDLLDPVESGADFSTEVSASNAPLASV